MSESKLEGFKHDLIIATEDGSVLCVPREVWDNDKYRIDAEQFETHDGWEVVRNLLRCGVNLATVPPYEFLPKSATKVVPMGTCYLVNIDGLKQNHTFIRERD